MVSRLNLADKMATFLGMPASEVSQLAGKMSKWYKRYEKPKKNGGKRVIFHPCRQLKALQYAVSEIVLNNFNIHPIAHAYIPGKASPLKKSAEEHASYRYTVRIDFKDFFPSIRPGDLKIRIEKAYTLSNSDNLLLGQILFYSGLAYQGIPPFLPIGAPTSPVISNIVMTDLDEKFDSISKAVDQDSGISRYADDLYFSTNEKGGCRQFHKGVQRLLSKTESPRLVINENKTLYLSKGTKRVVNGLYVTPDGNVSIGRERKTKIKSMIYKHSKSPLSVEELKRAQGVLAYIQDCEPEFYNRLAQKYGEHFYSIKDMKFTP